MLSFNEQTLGKRNNIFFNIYLSNCALFILLLLVPATAAHSLRTEVELEPQMCFHNADNIKHYQYKEIVPTL